MWVKGLEVLILELREGCEVSLSQSFESVGCCAAVVTAATLVRYRGQAIELHWLTTQYQEG